MSSLPFGEAYQLPPAPNRIEAELAQQFNDPGLWRSHEPVRMRAGRLAGLETAPGCDTAYTVGDRPSEHWVTLLYGSRVNPDVTWPQATFETVTLQTMTDMHAHLARTVLAGECIRPSVLVDPPVAKWGAIARNLDNNIFWLERIASGIWPIMATGEASPDGQKAYYSHDYADSHNAVCALQPKETQRLITQVAWHELAWITKYRAGQVPRLLSLPGDVPTNSLGMGHDGNIPYPDGMNIIDRATGTGHYVHLLHYLMHGQGATPEDRLSAVEAYPWASRNSVSTLHRAANGLISMHKHTQSMVNFISRHAYGRNATPEEIHAEHQRFRQGAVRIAKTILGEHDPAADAAPGLAIQNIPQGPRWAQLP